MTPSPLLFLKLITSFIIRPLQYRRTWAHLNYAFFSGWRYDSEAPEQAVKGGLKKRAYKSYEDYIRQQQSKLNIVHDGLKSQYDERCNRFKTSFSHHLADKPVQSVLCLGARDGVEVDALRQLGHLAIGIDIAYPKENKFVHYGDFHNLPFPNGSFDYAYTNAFDHTFDQLKVLEEVARVLKPETARFILDVPQGEGEIDTFESFGWENHQKLVDFLNAAGFSVEETRRRHEDDDYVQLLLKYESKAG